MNKLAELQGEFYQFLNGVCRHELDEALSLLPLAFLNGVCRHEHSDIPPEKFVGFLNGVCRHELADIVT